MKVCLSSLRSISEDISLGGLDLLQHHNIQTKQGDAIEIGLIELVFLCTPYMPFSHPYKAIRETYYSN
jgi:hypothetical protein